MLCGQFVSNLFGLMCQELEADLHLPNSILYKKESIKESTKSKHCGQKETFVWASVGLESPRISSGNFDEASTPGLP
jgi:hypothetical protein